MRRCMLLCANWPAGGAHLEPAKSVLAPLGPGLWLIAPLFSVRSGRTDQKGRLGTQKGAIYAFPNRKKDKHCANTAIRVCLFPPQKTAKSQV